MAIGSAILKMLYVREEPMEQSVYHWLYGTCRTFLENVASILGEPAAVTPEGIAILFMGCSMYYVPLGTSYEQHYEVLSHVCAA